MTVPARLLVVWIAFLVSVPTAHAWSWPVHGPVLQAFAYDEAHPYAGGQHRGIDVGADAAGEPVVAPAAGTVTFAGSVPTSGTCVTIETADGYSVTLTHLGSIAVARGAPVAEGDAVGTIGPSGTPEVDGPYLHLGVRVSADENGYVDPLDFLPPEIASSGGDSGSGSGDSPAPAEQAPADPPQPAQAPAPVPASAPAAVPARVQEPSAGSVARTRVVPHPASEPASRPAAVHSDRDSPPAGGSRAPAPTAPRAASEPAAVRERIGGKVRSKKPKERRNEDDEPAPEPVGRPGARTGAGDRSPLPAVERPTLRHPRPVRRPAPTQFLPLALGVGPGAVAATAALVVALLRRLRRRVVEPANAGRALVQLSRPSAREAARRAA